ncbi:MAG: NAD(P)/FAD-dependent oxidoreductase [Candidatus Omnitrophica bacterium]|nr:NAD(P)/FAD-dependent oxidoreductase [Candidatus Omnitrophota bacterium]MBU1869434.1 NAD(P)/FAD-dependent oxidoreductase [Candidatus Omnitrophota bacterium]
MKEYDCIIIGAGIGGLAAGLKLSYSGKKVLVIEKQTVCAGLATTFTRKGFVFESSLHCVDSLGEGGEVREFLEEFGVDKMVEFIELKDFCRLIYPDHDFLVDFNCDNLAASLKKDFPAESKNIDRLFREYKKFFEQFDRFCDLKLPGWIVMLILPFRFPLLIKTSLISVEQFISKFISDPKLASVITDIWRFVGLPPRRLAALYYLLVFKGYYYSHTAYIKGGFMRLFEAIVKKIKEQGSEVRFNTSIKKIIVEGRVVKGVVTDRDEKILSKTVISNANAIETLTELIDDPLLAKNYSQQLARIEKSISAVQVYLGLDIPAKELGMDHFMFSINTTYDHNESFDFSLKQDYQRCSLLLTDHAQIDPSVVPAGKGSILIISFDTFQHWSKFAKEEYRIKKIEVARQFIERVEKYLPGLSKHIEIMEVATPLTIARYGSSPEGAIYGFAQTIPQSGMNRLSQETKVKGLYLAGAWTRPGGGAHACFVSGRDAAELALRYLR